MVITRDDDLAKKIEQFSFPAIVKSQITIGSRKKAGLIKVVQTREEGIASN